MLFKVKLEYLGKPVSRYQEVRVVYETEQCDG